jgi:hypothetical protein
MQLPGARELIEGVRKGASNAKVAIFACVENARQSTATLNAGANFLLRKPLNVDAVALHITIAKEIMLRERRRYFRHPVNLPVALKDGDAEQHARIVNLSEGGMAVRGVKSLKQASGIEFWFELAFGAEISGRDWWLGQVPKGWRNLGPYPARNGARPSRCLAGSARAALAEAR